MEDQFLLTNHLTVELVGIVASMFVLGAFACKSVKLIRILDTIGAVLYIVYGILIKSVPNVFMNVVLVGIQAYHISKLLREKKK